MRIVSDRLTIEEAAGSEVATILGWTHALWGEGQAFEAYRTRTQQLMGTAWGQQHYRFIRGLDPEGRMVTCCKLYRLPLFLDGRRVPSVGFGAVFTPKAERRRGYAAELIRRVMADEAARGTQLAMLYSDIGAPFYERLGFRAVGAERGEAPSLFAPSPFRPLEPNEHSGISIWQAAMPQAALAFGRSPDYWQYLLERERPELFAYAPTPDAPPRGFAAVHLKPDRVFVDEVAYDRDVTPDAFYRGLRSFAEAQGKRRVAGWLPKVAERVGFAFRPLETALPMVAALQGQSLPHGVPLWALDHF